MTRIAATPSETSCLISNLFTELRPVCGFCEGDSVVLCGMTYAGTEEAVVLRDYGFDFTGDAAVVENIRNRRCINGIAKKLPAEPAQQGRKPASHSARRGQMIGFTLSTTDNPKRFPKKIRFSVTNKIQGHALAIYDYLVEANEIFPIMDDQDKADRLKLQRAALTECKKLLHMIQLSKDRGYIDSGTFDYWTKLTVDVKCMTARWYDAERKTGIPVEPAGPIPEG